MCKNANKFLGYWTTNYTPLLDTGKMKVLINSIHSSRAAILSSEVGVGEVRLTYGVSNPTSGGGVQLRFRTANSQILTSQFKWSAP